MLDNEKGFTLLGFAVLMVVIGSIISALILIGEAKLEVDSSTKFKKGDMISLAVFPETKGQVKFVACSFDGCQYKIRLPDGSIEYFDEFELIPVVETTINTIPGQPITQQRDVKSEMFNPNRKNPYARQ